MTLVLSGDGSVGPLSATEVGYLDGVTSGVQSQINGKPDTSVLGLTKITSQTLATVNTVSVNNCFSASFVNYRVVLTITTISANTGIAMRYRVGGVDAAGTSDYLTQETYSIGTTVAAGGAAISSLTVSGGYTGFASPTGMVIDVFGPALAAPTASFSCSSVRNSATALYNQTDVGNHILSTAYDGFTIFLNGATTMSGTLTVYGYK